MSLKEIHIRETKSEDINNVLEVEKQAFGYEKEAKLVAELLVDKTAKPTVSLMAFFDNEAIGHILFTRAYFNEGQNQPMMHILAPLAVIPKYQRKGIGGALLKAGIQKLQEKGSELVFVLGHKEYYPKYGFIPDAARLGYDSPYLIPEEYSDCWMVQAIGLKGFKAGKGKIKCSDMLNKPQHWRNEESDR